MTFGWQYFWPVIAAGLLVGGISGTIGFRRRSVRHAMLIGAAAALAAALLWHGPLGAADRFAGRVEAQVRFVLVDWEMGAVTARLQRGPLTRRLEFAGPADAFQRRELAKLLDRVPGVASATWSRSRAMPLAAEGGIAALLGFLIGLLIAYLVEFGAVTTRNGPGDMNMDMIRDYWWLLLIALGLAVLAFLLLRPRQRVRLSDSTPLRPHMAAPAKREGRGLAGVAAAAASDVTGELIGAQVHHKLGGGGEAADDLVLLKGVGPKLAETLRGLGFTRFEQIAGLSPTELERLDNQLGAFRGRLARDRVVEQANYLARGDTDGFEQKFGKL